MTLLRNTLLSLLALLGSSACFDESATLGLVCTADPQCASDQRCDLNEGICVNEEDWTPGGGSGAEGGESGDDGSSQGQPCSEEGLLECDPEGVDGRQCNNGTWDIAACAPGCEAVNEAPYAQLGGCVVVDGAVTCRCADGIGETGCGIDGQAACTDSGQLQFCLDDRLFRNDCGTACYFKDYPVSGPCIDDPGQGTPDCICADSKVLGACSITQQFEESCTSETVLSVCVDGDLYETDCMAECMRNGSLGGTCVSNGDIRSCQCT